MTQRSQLEQELLAKAARYLPGGGIGNTDCPDELRFLVRDGSGGRVRDVSGNEYIDRLMGSGPMILGHAHPAVTEAALRPDGSSPGATKPDEQCPASSTLAP